jgi:hypothetical protein
MPTVKHEEPILVDAALLCLCPHMKRLNCVPEVLNLLFEVPLSTTPGIFANRFGGSGTEVGVLALLLRVAVVLLTSARAAITLGVLKETFVHQKAEVERRRR